MRIQVNLSDEMIKRLDVKAEELGVSRSSLCAVAIGHYMDASSKSENMLKSIVDIVGSELSAQKPIV